MSDFVKYRRFWAGILAVLFLASFSGFSAVLHSCMMETASCCAPVRESDAAPGAVTRSMDGCCSLTVAGGLNTNPVIAEKQAKEEPTHIVFALLSPSAWCAPAPEVSAIPPFVSSSDASPPPVEQYVLTSTYLL